MGVAPLPMVLGDEDADRVRQFDPVAELKTGPARAYRRCTILRAALNFFAVRLRVRST